MKGTREEKPVEEAGSSNEAREGVSHGARVKKQISFQEPKKDSTENIPSEESSEEERSSSSIDNTNLQKTRKGKSDVESDSDIDIIEKATEQRDSSRISKAFKAGIDPPKNVVEISVHQKVPESLKPPLPEKGKVNHESQDSSSENEQETTSEENSETHEFVPYTPLSHSTSLENLKSKDIVPVHEEQLVIEETPIITSQPVLASAAFTALFSAFSPMTRSEVRPENSNVLKQTEGNVKGERKRHKFVKVPNEDAVIIPLHGSSDEDQRCDDTEEDQCYREITNKEKEGSRIPAQDSDKYIPTAPLDKLPNEGKSLVDEEDGLIQTLPNPSIEKHHINETQAAEQQLKPVVGPEIQTIQRIYGETDEREKPQLAVPITKVKDGVKGISQKKPKKRMFIKVPNEDAVVVPLHGSSDEEILDNAVGVRDTCTSDEPNQQEDCSDEAPNKYDVIVPLQGNPSEKEFEIDDNHIVTDQPSVATAAFTALFGAFSPLGEAEQSGKVETKGDQPSEESGSHGDRISESKGNISEKDLEKNISPEDEIAIQKPTVASAAFTSLFSAFSPLGERDSSKTINAEEDEKDLDENYGDRKVKKRKKRIFKKVSNENAVYIPLHSSSEEEEKVSSLKETGVEHSITHTNNENVSKENEEENSDAPNEYAVHIPLHDDVERGEENKLEGNGRLQIKPDESFAISHPSIASAAFSSLFSAFSPLGSITNSENKDMEDEGQNEKPVEIITAKKKRRIFKKVPNENAVFVPLHSSSNEEQSQEDEMPSMNTNEQSTKNDDGYSEAPNEYAVFVPLNDEADNKESKVGRNEKDSKKKKDPDDFAVRQPSVATAAFTALFSAFSPLGSTEQLKHENLERSANESEEKVNTEDHKNSTDAQREDNLEKKLQKKKKQRIFRKVPNENAVIIPLHSSSDEDINEVTGENSKLDDEETPSMTQPETSEEPNKYAVYVPLHGDHGTKYAIQDKKESEEKQKEDNFAIKNPSVATAAFTALFSAFSPLGGHVSTDEKEHVDNVLNEVEQQVDVQIVKKKQRVFKKVPNENAFLIPLHSSSDEEVAKCEEENNIVSGNREEDKIIEEPNKYSISVPLSDSKDRSNTKGDDSKSNNLNDDTNKKYEKENVLISQPSVATAAFTALYSASFSPSEGKSEVSIAANTTVNTTISSVKNEEVVDNALTNLPISSSEVIEEDVSQKKEEEEENNRNENDSKDSLNGTKEEEQVDIQSESIDQTTLVVIPVSALSPLSEKNQGEESSRLDESKPKRYKIRKQRIFKKVPNENAVFIPLHSSSDDERTSSEQNVHVEERDHAGETENYTEAPNEYKIFVPLAEEEQKNTSLQFEEANIEIRQPSIATAAFTALFSAFSPLGSTEQLRSGHVDSLVPENERTDISTDDSRKTDTKIHTAVIPSEESKGESTQSEQMQKDKDEQVKTTVTGVSKEKEEDLTKKEKSPVKSILKTSKTSDSNKKINVTGKNVDSVNGVPERRDKFVQIEEPLSSEKGTDQTPSPKAKETSDSKAGEQRTGTAPEGPKIVKAKQINIPGISKASFGMADTVMELLGKKGKEEIKEDEKCTSTQKENNTPCDHEYEPIQVTRAASQPDIRTPPLSINFKRGEEEDRYEVVKPQLAPVLQETRPNLLTEGGYEVIEEPKAEQRRCIKIPNENAIIVPLHGSSDEEINPDRYENPALMMSEEEIENFPRQPLPFVNIPSQNMSSTQPTAQEGVSFQEKLRTQADRFTTKFKGISKPKINIHKPKIKLPERPNIKMPEMPKIKLPERPKFNFPDKSKFHLPERPKFHLPDTSKFHLPDSFHFPEKPKFLTERPKFKLPEKFTQHEKKPKGPKGKKPNPSSLRRPLRDVVTISSQSTPGSTQNIFETLKFRTYPRFFKKKKAPPIQKMSSLDTESSQPSTPPRRPRRFSDQQQDTSWVHAYNRDIKFADEETNLRIERMEEEYERDENTAPFQENYEKDAPNILEHELKQSKAESMTSVVSEKGSSGSSSNRRRAGVIEEIDSDEFFVRQKGLSREDVDVSRYLSLEIRDAFRQPKNALASLDNELYDDEEPDMKFEHMPRAPQRSKAQKSASADRAQEFHTFPKRPSRRKESDPEIVVKPPRRFRSKSGSRYRSRQYSMPSLSGDVDMGPAPEVPRRKSRERSLRSLNREGRASDLDIVQTRITAQHSGDIPPVAPLRKSRSRGTSLADDDRTSRGADSLILPDDDEGPHSPHGGRGIDEDMMLADEIDEDDIVKEEKNEPIQFKESLHIDERFTDNSGYAVVTKDRKKPLRPPPPPHQQFDFQSQLDSIKTTGKNIFFTYPRRAIKSLHKPLPQRPIRNYNTLGPVRPPRRNRVFRKPVYMTGEGPPQLESLSDKERDLHSGEVVSRMKVRPLPPPPRPPRKSRDYDELEINDEPTPTDTLEATTEVEPPREEPETKETRSSYLKAKKDEFLRTISKFTSFDSKKEDENDGEQPIMQATISQQTSFDIGEVSVSIQTDPLPKDVIVIDQEIEETEEILILSDNNNRESREEKSETENTMQPRSVVHGKEKKTNEEAQKKGSDDSLEASMFQHALERVEAARGVLKEARERVIQGSTSSLEDRRGIDERITGDQSEPPSVRVPQRESLPASSRSEGVEKEGTPPPLPARPLYTKPIPVSFPDKLHLSELDVDRLNVSEIQANKIKVSEIESTCIDVAELTSRGGNLTLNGIELPPDFISNVVAQVTTQVQSQVQNQIQAQVQAQVQSRVSQPVQREVTPQRQLRRVLTPPPPIVVQTSPEVVSFPVPNAPGTEQTEYIPQPRTTKSKGRKSPTRVIDDSEDELASTMPQRREKEKIQKEKSESSKAEDPSVPSPPIDEGATGPSLGQASSFQLIGRLCSIWKGHTAAGAGSFVQGVNSLFPDGEKRRDAQIAAVILLILITGLILIGFGFDHSVHHHHWDYLPPR